MEKNPVAELCYHLPEAAHEQLCHTREETGAVKSRLGSAFVRLVVAVVSRRPPLPMSVV
jgi:hypothetical protein